MHSNIISIDNLLIAWREFLRGKRKRKDVIKFSVNLTDNIISLHYQLRDKTYKHGSYFAFKINDPKPRDIHKATVADRLVHHAIYRILYPLYDTKFIFDSFSCRYDKGVQRGIDRFRSYARRVSRNNTRTVWVLKGDIRKFFANIDHAVLKDVLKRRISDEDVLWLLGEIIDSFETQGRPNIGLPLGNLTSQLLVNVYMNEFDQFLKRKLKVQHCIRYADDFVIFHHDRSYLENLIPNISTYLETNLHLSLHPDKLFIKPLASGVDFLGWVHFPTHRIVRKSTERRAFRRVKQNPRNETLQSYLGLLSHGNTYELRQTLVEKYSVWKENAELARQNKTAEQQSQQ